MKKQVKMNEYEESRRAFLTKLGMTVGVTTLAGKTISAKVLNDKTEFPLTKEQQKLMDRYENGWTNLYL